MTSRTKFSSIRILFVGFVLGIFSSCGNSGTNETDSTATKEITKNNMHDITTTEAYSMISAFLSKHETIARRQGIGGGFSSSTLLAAGVQSSSQDPGFLGGTMFFHLLDNVSANPRLYSGLQQITRFDSSNGCRNPYRPLPASNVMLPDETFVYSSATIDSSAVSAFLNSLQSVQPQRVDSLQYSRVSADASAFLTSFPENAYSYGLFSLGSVMDILAQKDSTGASVCTGVRYFYGYDAVGDSNKIHVILVGVDSTGKNVLTIDGIQALIRDRSIPPVFK